MIKMVNAQYVRVYVICVCKFIELYTYNYFYLYALLPALIVHKFTNDNLWWACGRRYAVVFTICHSRVRVCAFLWSGIIRPIIGTFGCFRGPFDVARLFVKCITNNNQWCDEHDDCNDDHYALKIQSWHRHGTCRRTVIWIHVILI